MVACAPPRDKQHFNLKNTTWRAYSNGDYLRYQFLAFNGDGSSFSGDWITRWQNVPLPPPSPSSQVPANLMRISNSITPFNQPPRTMFYYIQQEKDRSVLFALQQEGGTAVNYLVDNNDKYGITLYPTNLTVGATQPTTVFSFVTCRDQLCSNKITGGSMDYYIETTEVVETPFGFFECYRIKFKQNFNANFPLYNGTVWVYPPLGMVKASMSFLDSASAKMYSYDEIALVETNIAVSP